MDSDQIINFLDSKFITSIKCSCAVEDSHPIENLISNEKQKSNHGFMAFRVTKPPVELEFQLRCCIELGSIKIWPRIDSLKSNGFEILINNDLTQEYFKSAKHFNLQENAIQFINSSFNSNHDTKSDFDEAFAIVPFFPSQKNRLRKVKNIKIIIKQTESRCVPVIKRLEIWGKISKFATHEQREFINEIIAQEIKQTEYKHTDERKKNDENSDFLSKEELRENLTVPEEFLDTITFDIMTLPMVLPSGKIIDNSTLLKYIEQEEKWGRVASDPFTGQPFTDSRKAVLNVHLKAQIDSFLLKNSRIKSIATLPRTVGSVTKKRKEQIDCDKDWKLVKTDCIHQNNDTILGRHPDESIEMSTSPLIALPSTSSSTSMITTIINHSLDDAIKGVLKVGKYTTNTATQNDSNIKNCFQCLQSGNNSLYTIFTCSHLICRVCLVNRSLSTCKCGQEFTNVDVNRYHHRRIL